jgi:hypothetical protein
MERNTPTDYGADVRPVALVNGTHHVDANGVDWWENLVFSQIRDAEINLGVSVFLG